MLLKAGGHKLKAGEMFLTKQNNSIDWAASPAGLARFNLISYRSCLSHTSTAEFKLSRALKLNSLFLFRVNSNSSVKGIYTPISQLEWSHSKEEGIKAALHCIGHCEVWGHQHQLEYSALKAKLPTEPWSFQKSWRSKLEKCIVDKTVTL